MHKIHFPWPDAILTVPPSLVWPRSSLVLSLIRECVCQPLMRAVIEDNVGAKITTNEFTGCTRPPLDTAIVLWYDLWTFSSSQTPSQWAKMGSQSHQHKSFPFAIPTRTHCPYKLILTIPWSYNNIRMYHQKRNMNHMTESQNGNDIGNPPLLQFYRRSVQLKDIPSGKVTSFLNSCLKKMCMACQKPCSDNQYTFSRLLCFVWDHISGASAWNILLLCLLFTVPVLHLLKQLCNASWHEISQPTVAIGNRVYFRNWDLSICIYFYI